MGFDETLEILASMAGAVQRNPDGGGQISLSKLMNAGGVMEDQKDRKMTREAQKLALEQSKYLFEEQKKQQPLRDAQLDAQMWGLKEQRAAAAKAKIHEEEQERMDYRKRFRAAAAKGEEIEAPTARFMSKGGQVIPTEEGAAFQDYQKAGFKAPSEKIEWQQEVPGKVRANTLTAGPIAFASDVMSPFSGKKEQKHTIFVKDPLRKDKWLFDESMSEAVLADQLKAMVQRPDIFTDTDRQEVNMLLTKKTEQSLQMQQVVGKLAEEAVQNNVLTPDQANAWYNTNKMIGKFDPDFSQTSIKMMEAVKNRDIGSLWSAFSEYGFKRAQQSYMTSPFFAASEKLKIQEPDTRLQPGQQAATNYQPPIEKTKLIKQKSLKERLTR